MRRALALPLSRAPLFQTNYGCSNHLYMDRNPAPFQRNLLCYLLLPIFHQRR
jgi:hypothetical protein